MSGEQIFRSHALVRYTRRHFGHGRRWTKRREIGAKDPSDGRGAGAADRMRRTPSAGRRAAGASGVGVGGRAGAIERQRRRRHSCAAADWEVPSGHARIFQHTDTHTSFTLCLRHMPSFIVSVVPAYSSSGGCFTFLLPLVGDLYVDIL